MTANVLSQNFYNYMRVQHDIKHAIRGEKPDVVRELAKELQQPAQSLTEYEREYTEWVLGLYSRISIPLLKDAIKKMAKFDRRYKEAQKDLHREKITWSELNKVWQERPFGVTTTQLCSLRAAMRGRLHQKTMSFSEQREIADQIVHLFNRVKEE